MTCKLWLATILGWQHAARGDRFGEWSLVAAKLRRTLDVRLVTASMFGPRFFCGQYVLADCTDETSANFLATDEVLTRIYIQFAPNTSGSCSRVACCLCSVVRQEFNTESVRFRQLFSLERFRGVVRQQLLH